MANLRMTLLDLLNKDEQCADPSFLRDGVRLLAQELMDAEVTQFGGCRAARAEREPADLPQRLPGARVGHHGRHGRPPNPQAPRGRLLPEPPGACRRRHERALLAVVQEAYVHGVSTRAVDSLAEALGLKGISKNQVSRICK